MKKMKKFVLILLAVLMVTPVAVYASRPRELEYAHVLSRALRIPEIIPLDRESRAAAEQARRLHDEFVEITRRSDSFYAYAIYTQVLELRAESARLARERIRLSAEVEVQLRRQLATIAGIEFNMILLESTIELNEMVLEQTQIRLQHGVASERDVREAELALDQSIVEMDMLGLTLQNERTSLNRLIGHPITSDLIIIYDIYDIEPVGEETRSERSITRQVARDHDWLNWIDIVAVHHHHWQSNIDNPEEDNRYNRVQHQMAVFERNMAERTAEQRVRAAFDNWDHLIEQQEAIQADLAAAQAEYENMQERLEAGLVIPLQVDQMRVAVQAQEVRLARHSYEFWVARIRIDHPYVR